MASTWHHIYVVQNSAFVTQCTLPCHSKVLGIPLKPTLEVERLEKLKQETALLESPEGIEPDTCTLDMGWLNLYWPPTLGYMRSGPTYYPQNVSTLANVCCLTTKKGRHIAIQIDGWEKYHPTRSVTTRDTATFVLSLSPP